jgi:DNA repair exonuclease SbcCD ATPase subunit
MIVFESIRWKNFLSTGNAWTEIKLNEHPNTLIIGHNGSGKSTLLDAITFCLFGTAFRDINKGGLVNSVNNKDCLTECVFTSGKNQFKIVRGIKPNIFEIYCDGTLLNQDSTTKDYQKHLEQFILKMNKKAFTQIDILGSTSFTPFMQLKPPERRLIIEDLLDIQIFTTMNTLTKSRLQKNKEGVEKNRIALVGKEESMKFVKRTIDSLEQNNDSKLKALTTQRANYHGHVTTFKQTVIDLQNEADALRRDITNIAKVKTKYREYIDLQSRLDLKAKASKEELSFYHDNDTCPTCQQDIAGEFKEAIVCKTKQTSDELEASVLNITQLIDSKLEEIHELDKKQARISAIEGEIDIWNSRIVSNESIIVDLEKAIHEATNADTILIDAQKEYDDLAADTDALNKEREELLVERQYIEAALILLKDQGIKAKVIKQYLPVINTLINKYLTKMGFNVNFHINENFEETIKSRYRDEFAYHNFSEGEKARIDLAILFTWRAIAKMRNSVNTNLLIFDEIFDSSLDMTGTDEFVKIMYENHDINIFVISHKTDLLLDKFKKVYRFEKKRNHSVIGK